MGGKTILFGAAAGLIGAAHALLNSTSTNAPFHYKDVAGDLLDKASNVYETNPISVAALLLGLSTTLVSWRVREAHNLSKNNHGVAQNSSFFYQVMPAGFQWVSALPYIMNFVPTASVFIGLALGGNWTWFTAIAGYVVVPLLDLVVGEDSYNPTPEEESYLKKNVWFRVLTWLYPPLYIFSVIYGAYHISQHPELSVFEIAGITVSTAIAGGFGIGCIHELIHRPTHFELGIARISLVFSSYAHFWIEHLWGHHKRVATDEDPASSAVGDDVYTFLIKCWIGVAKSAWNIEAKFLEKKGYNRFNVFQNRIIQGWAASSLVGAAIYFNFGFNAWAFFLGQGIGVWAHIDNANYIEHYGLRRRKTGVVDKDGEVEYERPGWYHAWNTADRVSNYILFKIERHPDHHTNAGRPFQILRHFKESPTMPTGYAGMFVLSWFPPLWWAIMDPLVKNAHTEWYKYERASQKAREERYAFPKGSNNISSVFKREGEGFFEEGSSPYQKDNFYGSDKDTNRVVWDTDFQKNVENAKLVAPVH